MQTYEVKITQYALYRLNEIAHHIAYELMSPQAAVNTVKAIQSEINDLNFMPERIPLIDEEPWRSEGIHKMLVGNFFVYFWVDKDNLRVQVIDIIYARRDQKNALQDTPMK